MTEKLPPEIPSALQLTDEKAESRPASKIISRRKRLAFLAAALTFSFVFALCLVEVLLRIAGFSYHLYPDRVEFGYPDPKALSDSFLPDPDVFWVEKTYPQRLEEARRDRPPLVVMGCSCTIGFAGMSYADDFEKFCRIQQKQTVRYFNAACIGWSTQQGLVQLKRDILPMRPKVVTIYYGWNDHWYGFGVRDSEVWRLNHSWMALLQKLRTAQLITKALVSAKAINRSEYPLRVPPEEFRANLTEMVKAARQADTEPVLITAPTSHLQGQEPALVGRRWLKNLSDLVPLHQQYVEIVRDVGRQQNVKVFDLAQEYDRFPRAQKLELFLDDGIHFTPKGFHLAGKLMYDFFAREGLLKGLTSPVDAGNQTPQPAPKGTL